MLIQMPEGAVIPGYQTELIAWLDGFTGTEHIQQVVSHSKMSEEECLRWRELWAKHLTPKVAKRKEQFHARSLG